MKYDELVALAQKHGLKLEHFRGPTWIGYFEGMSLDIAIVWDGDQIEPWMSARLQALVNPN